MYSACDLFGLFFTTPRLRHMKCVFADWCLSYLLVCSLCVHLANFSADTKYKKPFGI